MAVVQYAHQPVQVLAFDTPNDSCFNNTSNCYPAPAGIKPEWYFVFMFQTLKFIPAKVFGLDGEMLGVFGFAVLGTVLVLVPLLDRKAALGQTGKLFSALGVVALVYIIIMTIISYIVPQTF